MSNRVTPSRSDEFKIAGQFGGVYVVNHLSNGDRLAAKIVNLDVASNHELDSLSRTIWARSMLRHTNLLPLICAFVEKSSLWMISPFCDLGPASDLCKPLGLPEATISLIILSTLTALEYLHERGYSIDVIQDGVWRSKIHDFPPDATKCLNWLAPEILAQNLLGYSFKSDIYSLGVTCCELANGIAPYEGLEPSRMLLEKLTGNHPKPIDSSTIDLFPLPEDADEEETRKYSIYKKRRFSEHLHHFTSHTCLLTDPDLRPPASQLLKHKFIKQAKKLSDSSKGASISNFFTSRASTSAASDALSKLTEAPNITITSVDEETLMSQMMEGGGSGDGKMSSKQEDLIYTNIIWEFQEKIK